MCTAGSTPRPIVAFCSREQDRTQVVGDARKDAASDACNVFRQLHPREPDSRASPPNGSVRDGRGRSSDSRAGDETSLIYWSPLPEARSFSALTTVVPDYRCGAVPELASKPHRIPFQVCLLRTDTAGGRTIVRRRDDGQRNAVLRRMHDGRCRTKNFCADHAGMHAQTKCAGRDRRWRFRTAHSPVRPVYPVETSSFFTGRHGRQPLPIRIILNMIRSRPYRIDR